MIARAQRKNGGCRLLKRNGSRRLGALKQLTSRLDPASNFLNGQRQGSFDLVYLTEVDPLWADDELTAILNPEAVLFANAPAKAAAHGKTKGKGAWHDPFAD